MGEGGGGGGGGGGGHHHFCLPFLLFLLQQVRLHFRLPCLLFFLPPFCLRVQLCLFGFLCLFFFEFSFHFQFRFGLLEFFRLSFFFCLLRTKRGVVHMFDGSEVRQIHGGGRGGVGGGERARGWKRLETPLPFHPLPFHVVLLPLKVGPSRPKTWYLIWVFQSCKNKCAYTPKVKT
jgi:hypothetical protein